MIATACDVGGSFGPLGCTRHVGSAATRPTATTGENRVMREPMAHLGPGAYLPRRSRALEVGAGSGTNGTKLRRFAGQRKIVGRPAALPTTYVPSEGPMLQYTYLIVGGGMTADAAAQGIREVDANGTIGLVGAEPHPPYNRPPLSKALWKGDPEESIWRKTAATGAQLTLGRRVTAIDPRGHTATDDRGTVCRFEKLLLATGGLPRRLPAQSDAVIYFRTLEDYRRLRRLAGAGARSRSRRRPGGAWRRGASSERSAAPASRTGTPRATSPSSRTRRRGMGPGCEAGTRETPVRWDATPAWPWGAGRLATMISG